MSAQLNVLFCVAENVGSAAALDPLSHQYRPLLNVVSDDPDIARANCSAISSRNPASAYVVLQGVVKWEPLSDKSPRKKKVGKVAKKKTSKKR